MRAIKICILSIILALCSSLAFAFEKDYTITQYLGEMEYEQFLQAMQILSGEQILSLFSMGLEQGDENPFKVTKFASITEDNADDEDYELVDYVESYLEDEEFIDENDGYLVLVFRTMLEDAIDGWMVLTHYCEEEDYTHYIYYFCLEK